MNDWHPTMTLRFINRYANSDELAAKKVVKVLQQKWIKTSTNWNDVVIGQEEEWRDVPVEREK